MPSSASRSRPLALFLLVLALLGASLVFLLGRGRAGDEVLPVAAPEASAPKVVEASELAAVPLVPPVQVVLSDEELAGTTVLWPLRVELDLLQAFYLPTEKGVVPIGSGASARLMGRIMAPGDVGARAEVRFIAGANEGRILHTDAKGAFGATDLYPGLSIVEVRGDDILGSRREVRLRQERESLLNIGYGRPGSVAGRVQDRDGKGLEGARVTMDGTRVVTGPDGEFFLASVAGGQVLVEVELEGYAEYQELAMVAAGRSNPKERMTFTLEPATSLKVALTSGVGGPGPAYLYLLPGQESRRPHAASAHRNMRFPWHRKNPVEVWPGSPVTIEGLPAEVVKVYAFRAGTGGSLQVVNLSTGRERNLKIPLKPAPKITGTVRFQGKPVADALVRLEAPNRVRATLSYFRQASYYLETAVMPNMPPALQEVRTGANGHFSLTAWSDQSPTRFLEARGPDGRTWAGRLVHRGEEVCDIELKEVDLGDSELELEFPGRWQGLPLEVLIQGAPMDPWILPLHENMRLRDLLAGRWNLRVSWHGTPVFEETLEIRGYAKREIELPPECIDGQDEESWRRAGREYPGTE